MDTAQVNIKGMPSAEWERVRRNAKKSGESLGTWVGRACKLLSDMEEAAGRVQPPPARPSTPAPGNAPVDWWTASRVPVPDSVTEVALLLQAVAAASAATGVAPPKADMKRMLALADESVRAVRGLPPRPVRLPRQKIIEAS